MTTGRINQVVSSLSIETADQEERQLQQQRPAATGRVEKLSKAQGGSLSLSSLYVSLVFAGEAQLLSLLAFCGDLYFCELSQYGFGPALFVPPASPATLCP